MARLDAIPERVEALAKPDPELAFTKPGGRDLLDTPRALFYAGRAYGLCAEAKPAASFWKQAARKTVAPESPQAVFVAFARIQLLALAGRFIVPKLLELYPAIVWEDQDECLAVQPEDIEL